jgi:hypothetical protein
VGDGHDFLGVCAGCPGNTAGHLDTRKSNQGLLGWPRLSSRNSPIAKPLVAACPTLTRGPDWLGELLYNGIAQHASKRDVAYAVQKDSSYQLTDNHTIRGGVYFQHDRATSRTNSQVLPDRRVGETSCPAAGSVAWQCGYLGDVVEGHEAVGGALSYLRRGHDRRGWLQRSRTSDTLDGCPCAVDGPRLAQPLATLRIDGWCLARRLARVGLGHPKASHNRLPPFTMQYVTHGLSD